MLRQVSRSLYTAEDLVKLSVQGRRYELIRGDLVDMTPAGPRHGNASQRLARYVGAFIEEHDLGEDFAAETGFLIARNPDTVMAHDYAYIARERLPEVWPVTGFMPVAPDIVLETRSPNDTVREVALKVERWLQAGVRIVWELDPEARILTVHRSDTIPRLLGVEDALEGEEILPGFTLPIRRLFRNA